jgi:sarcosine oxidase
MAGARYDVIVVGVGGMGSAALYHLARRGKRVLGLERYDIPHEMGSSHGITRVIRLAYFEHPSYVRLLYRAYELWRELQHEAGEQLLHITGSIDAGPPDSLNFLGSKRSCEEHHLSHEVLTSEELSRRFPGYRLPAQTMAVFQPDGGFVLPERCIVAHVTRAQAHGAQVHAREPVRDWQAAAGGVRVVTDRGTYEADRLIISAGAWLGQLVEALAQVAVPERQVLGWFHPLRPDLFGPQCLPVFNITVPEGRYYGLPVFGIPGFKVGCYHHHREDGAPDRIDRDFHPRDETTLRTFVEKYFPAGAGPTMSMKVCIFTNTPDEHFILDVHPEYPQVCIASPCSGHGFKFCSVVGEIMADLAENGRTKHPIEMFRLSRFGAKQAASVGG